MKPLKTIAQALTLCFTVSIMVCQGEAATFVVTNILDSGSGTLRQAVSSASAAGGGSIIFSNLTGTITLANGELMISKSINVMGPGATNLIISANYGSRVFNVSTGATVSISGLTVRGGLPSYTNDLYNQNPGGGIYNAGDLNLSRCGIIGNATVGGGYPPVNGGRGAGIYNAGTMVADNCTISSNYCGNGGGGGTDQYTQGRDGGSGGGVYNTGSLTLNSCTISGNSSGNGGAGGYEHVYPGGSGGAGGSGGGIFNAGNISMTNCTLYGNSDGNGGNGSIGYLGNFGGSPTSGGNGGNGGSGGGVFNLGIMKLSSCTISSNGSAQGGSAGPAGGAGASPGNPGSIGSGGGIWTAGGGSGQLLNSLIANNTSPGVGPNVSGNFASQGYNLLGNTNGSSGFGVNGDIINVNPLLGPLADNGGPTLTMALLPGSPALDAGTSFGAPTIDQRGITRPQGSAMDIGAFELVVSTPFLTVTPAILDFGFISTGTTADRLFYVTNTGGGTLVGNATVTTPFSIFTGGSYSLGANQGQSVTVRYSPSLAGVNSQIVSFTGGAGASRTVSGSAVAANLPPQLTGMAISNAVFQFILNGPVGSNYVIQVSSNLVTWTAISTNQIPPGGLMSLVTQSIATQPRLFYRAVPFDGTYGGTVNASLTGRIVAWGSNSIGQTNAPAGTNWIAVAGGFYHSLALKADGTVVGWGENDLNQTNTPPGLSKVVAIAAGWGTSFALKKDGTVLNWGWNPASGLLAFATNLTSVASISADWDCCMALKSNGTVVVWGVSTHGETNVPSGLTNVTAIAGGGNHCLALKSDTTVVAWGDNGYNKTNVPAGLTNVTAIAAGGGHSLALRANGTVVAWGNNGSGQANVPAGLSNVMAISAGNSHSLALKADGTIMVWGDNASGQTNSPVNLTNAVFVSAGGFHNLVIRNP